MKTFTCTWGDGYTAIDQPATVENHSLSWFTTNRGYTAENITDIHGLYIGECLSLDDSGCHSIVRIA